MPNNEIWKDVPSWEKWYQVSNKGRVRSLTRVSNCGWKAGLSKEAVYQGKILSSPISGSGYRVVCFSAPGRREYHNVHRLVAEIFIGPCPAGLEVCHNDGVYENCEVKNLRYDTRQNNALDRNKHGTQVKKGHCKGEENGLARLTEEKVRYIRNKPSLTLEFLGDKFGVHLGTIHAARAGKTWRHVK